MATTQHAVIVGVFADRTEAEQAKKELLGAGYGQEQIKTSLEDLAPSKVVSSSTPTQNEMVRDGAIGGGAGALLGSGAGFLAHKLNSSLNTRPLWLTLLAGAAIGSMVGGMPGLLIGKRMSSSQAQQNEASPSRVLIAIETDNPQDILDTMRRNGAYEVRNTPLPTVQRPQTPAPTPTVQGSQTPAPTPAVQGSQTPAPTPTVQGSQAPVPTPTSSQTQTSATNEASRAAREAQQAPQSTEPAIPRVVHPSAPAARQAPQGTGQETPQAPSLVVSAFPDQGTADSAIDALLEAGFTSEQIRYSVHGAAGGGIQQDLIKMGVPSSDAQMYEQEFELQWNTIVTVQTHDRQQEARYLMETHGSYNIRQFSLQPPSASVPQQEAMHDIKLREEQFRVKKQ